MENKLFEGNTEEYDDSQEVRSPKWKGKINKQQIPLQIAIDINSYTSLIYLLQVQNYL